MAHTGIFATSDEIIVKAGAGYNSVDITEARINALCAQVESYINAYCTYNYSDAYAGLNADVKGLLSEVASDLVAIYMISYDMSGYDSRTEAEDMVNILRDAALRGLAILKDKETQRFINGA